MKELLSMSLPQLQTLLSDMGEKAFVARQIKEWLTKGVVFEQMTNVSKTLRSKLRESCSEGYAKVIQKLVSDDGTVKYLLGLSDGSRVECVVMQYNHGRTVCISTQVGCRMGCLFCASGKEGLVRNLNAGEMRAQLIAARSEGDISNVVLMGSGEPLDNYEHTIAFVRSLPEDFGIGIRHISLSTCGLVPGINKLTQEGLPLTLCLSLHAATDEKRQRIMPVANAYAIKQIINAAKAYFQNTGRRIIIEYTLMRGFNDSADDAAALAQVLKGLNCHINVIPLNAGGQSEMAQKTPTTRQAHAFCAMLIDKDQSATVRRALGSDIEGACGQLALKREEQ